MNIYQHCILNVIFEKYQMLCPPFIYCTRIRILYISICKYCTLFKNTYMLMLMRI